ncbi:MAG TPA: peptidoglycan DD-metalloendopeptidase family protein [Bacteroidales bacterium]|nr:peptidoglycan DD-metalloendopeptidase family protein [Bacteroidales bacterium]HPI68557.1 peptidoglycan DD-metalloendopeptidase family protein [Bacteroidales bacterium]HPR72504.1 peptidoglycan DD-metalloendopeptidase family protein [Bacteroidales bacterium]HRW85789.1 peptidoglycan DD-metalloendopeptidase family protein [Bacteroidales bacterium]
MKKSIIIYYLLFLITSVGLQGQSRAELEEQRKKTLEEIAYVDNLLSVTTKEKSESLSALRMLNNKVRLRENVIEQINSEMDLLNQRIELNRTAVRMMEEDLELMRKEYSAAIVNAYRARKLNPDIVYIMSAKDFNQGYKRLKYLQQVSRIRRTETEIISELIKLIDESEERLEADFQNLSLLKIRELQQRNLLSGEQNRRSRMVRNLTAKEKQLQQDLEQKKKIAQRLEKELARLIEEEKKRSRLETLTPEQRLTGDDFRSNKGKLPWPVEKGVITSKFGTHQHPVLKYVTEKNDGIDITSTGITKARSVFKGEVSTITAIQGANMTVIIRHGNFLTVYNNLINVKVKRGDIVQTKQEIGEVFADPGESNNCTIKFMIFEQKFLDPEQWIAKI